MERSAVADGKKAWELRVHHPPGVRLGLTRGANLGIRGFGGGGGWGFEGGRVLKDPAGVVGDAFHSGGVGGVRGSNASVIGARSLGGVAVEAVEKLTEEEAGVSG